MCVLCPHPHQPLPQPSAGASLLCLSLRHELLDPVTLVGCRDSVYTGLGSQAPGPSLSTSSRAVGPLSSRQSYPVSTFAPTIHLRHAPPCHLHSIDSDPPSKPLGLAWPGLSTMLELIALYDICWEGSNGLCIFLCLPSVSSGEALPGGVRQFLWKKSPQPAKGLCLSPAQLRLVLRVGPQCFSIVSSPSVLVSQ